MYYSIVLCPVNRRENHGVSNPVFQTHSKDQGALTIMGFPPQSPDLNPIEYLWGLGLRTEKAKHYVISQDAL